MSDPINLDVERTKRAQPDAEFVTTDEYGRKFYKFTAEYTLGTDRFALDFWASDEADARARVQAIRSELQFSGQLFGVVNG